MITELTRADTEEDSHSADDGQTAVRQTVDVAIGEAIGVAIGGVSAELAALRTEVAREHERAAARERAIDRLHEENERLRAGERQLLLRPLLVDLQRLRHDLLREAGRLPEQLSGDATAQMLRSYAQSLELTLERGGVQVLMPAPGAPFDPGAHRVSGTVPVDDPAADATIAEVVLDGYRDVHADRTVIPATVRVHRWVEPVTVDGAAD